jgi:hypothetical protein
VSLEDAGVVDQDVETAEPVGRSVDGAAYGVRVSHVGLHHRMTLPGQGVTSLLGEVGVRPVMNGHGVAGLGERMRDRAPDAT